MLSGKVKVTKVSRKFDSSTTDELNKKILTAYGQQLTKFVHDGYNHEIVSVRKKNDSYSFTMIKSRHYDRDRSAFARFS